MSDGTSVSVAPKLELEVVDTVGLGMHLVQLCLWADQGVAYRCYFGAGAEFCQFHCWGAWRSGQ